MSDFSTWSFALGFFVGMAVMRASGLFRFRIKTKRGVIQFNWDDSKCESSG